MVTPRFDALDENARELFVTAMRWMERSWDDGAGLLWGGGDTAAAGPVHTTRGSVWYAIGLLMRQNPGDLPRAIRVFDTVLNHQFDAPGRVFHGTFLRAPEEPPPPDEAVIWRDYDPNWREFIITALQLALLEYADRLPARLVDKIDAAVRRAVMGALARGLSPSYTNIALMHAFMLCCAGARFGEPRWSAEGERMARQVYKLYEPHRAFAEYNSPTYYGVDLYALALWRSFPALTPLLALLGAEMEDALWRQIAQFDHAGLRNLAGPYDRSYGMDLCAYVALVGIWIRLATGKPNAPLPDLEMPPTGADDAGERRAPPFAHAHDLGFAPLFAFLGVRVPADALTTLGAFPGERQIENVITDDPRRVATAWLGPSRMLGGEFTGRTAPASGQFHPATLHWRIDPEHIGWVRLLYEAPVDAQASRDRLEIRTTGHVSFIVHAPGAERGGFERDCWRLPGLSVRVTTKADQMTVCLREGLFEIRYAMAEHQPIDCILDCGEEHP